MSEYRVDAYFIEKQTLQQAVGSKNQALKEQILADKSEILTEFSSRFSGKTLADTVNELVDGNIEEGFPFHYSFSTWALVDTLSESRPDNPFIPYPFVDLYELVEILEERKDYPKLKSIFEALNGMNSDFELPLPIDEWGDMPCFCYLETVDKSIAKEAEQMKEEINKEEDWTFDLDDMIEIEPILDWLMQAHRLNKSLCLVMEGDL